LGAFCCPSSVVESVAFGSAILEVDVVVVDAELELVAGVPVLPVLYVSGSVRTVDVGGIKLYDDDVIIVGTEAPVP
jgi:hypothetical protein